MNQDALPPPRPNTRKSFRINDLAHVAGEATSRRRVAKILRGVHVLVSTFGRGRAGAWEWADLLPFLGSGGL
jgi:hypothetical protein